MNKLYGTPVNIQESIIGKITFKSSFFSKKKDDILVTKDSKPHKGFSAIITGLPDISYNGATVLGVENIQELNEGDIVVIEPSGNINVVYEVNSTHNSLFVTDRCNCACIMCPQPRLDNEEEKTSLNLKLISLMDKKTSLLGITGGEPTLIGDELIDLIQSCKQNLSKTSLNLLTNGILFQNFDYVRKLVLVNHPDLVIDIPLYSDTDTVHDKIIGTKGFNKTIKGLYNLACFNQKIGIRIVVHKLTYERLPQLAEFIYHNFPFVYYIAFMQMELIGDAKKNTDDLWIDPYEYNEQLEEAVMYLAQRDMNVSIYNSQLCILPKSLWKYARKSISTWKNIYIDKCEGCDVQNDCAGFFASSLDIHSNYVKPVSGKL